MGSWASFSIGAFDFLYTKNSFFDQLNYFYNSNDLVIREEIEDDEVYKYYCFETNVKTFKTCLNLMGHTIKKAKAEYEKNMINILYDAIPECMIEDGERTLKYIRRNYSFNKWQKYVKEYAKKLISGELNPYSDSNKQTESVCNNKCKQLVFDSVTDWQSETFFGVPYEEYDILNTIRIFIDGLDDDVKVEYDITDLIDSGYCSTDDFTNIDEWPIKKKIVLVEGSTDKAIIDFSFKQIYPHYSKFFYLMDFDSPKRQGSACEITRIIKAFANSGLDSEFIALYDNDVAGKKEIVIKKEQGIKYPNNITVKTYPDIHFASKYPTMGTNKKIILDDVNGRACSIELYLPKRFLTDADGKLFYIVWKSLDDKLKEYQGEISNKQTVFDRFLKYRKDVEAGKNTFNIEEWQNMILLIDSFAFDY